MEDGSEKILFPPQPDKEVLSHIDNPVVHLPSDYGFSLPSISTQGIKIAVIDSGCPVHKDIKNIKDYTILIDNVKTPDDRFGHASMVAGVMAANNQKNLLGIAHKSNLFFAKVTTDDGESDFNAVVAGVLWAIVKTVDIIVLAIGTTTDYDLLHSAIQKAFEANICVVAACMNGKQETFPAAYPEVLGFQVKTKNSRHDNQHEKDGSIIIQLPSHGVITASGKHQYIKAYGPSIATGIGAGITAMLIANEKGKSWKPSNIYGIIKKMRG